MTAFFIAGTDTEIGKTFVTCALLHAARAQGAVACRHETHRRRHDLVGGELINETPPACAPPAASTPASRCSTPGFASRAPSPHIAAAEEGVVIEPAPSSPPSPRCRPRPTWCWWRASAASACPGQRLRHRRPRPRPGPAGDPGGGHAPRLHQPRPPHRQPDRPGGAGASSRT